MPRYSFNSDKKALEKQRGFENDLALQNADERTQGNMLNQLSQLYGISTQERLLPGQLQAQQVNLRGTNLQNDAAQFQNDWAQPNMEQAYGLRNEAMKGADIQNQRNAGEAAWDETMKQQQYRLGDAQIAGVDALSQKRDELNPQYLPFLLQSYPNETLDYIMPPGMKEIMAGQKAQKEIEQQAAIQAEEKQFVPPASAGIQVDPQYLNDPEIARMVQAANNKTMQDKEYYKKGGGLDVEQERNKVRRQTSPKQQTLRDLLSLYGL